MEVHLKKNVAAQIVVPAVTTASPETFDTGETLADTAFYSDAAGAWTTLAITDTFTEISTTGVYVIDLTAAELNHDVIMIKATSGTIADTCIIIRTFAHDIDDVLDANDRVDVGSFLGQAVTLSAGNIPDVNAAEISDSSAAADNVEANIGNLNATVSSRSDFDETADPVEILDTGGTAGTSATELVTDIWAAGTRDITGGTIDTVGDKTDYALSAAGIDAIWDELVTGHVTASSFAKLLIDNIDAVISTRSSHSAADVWTAGTRGLTENVTVGAVIAAALADFFDTDSTTNYASAVAGSVVKEIADNAGGSALTESGIADAVWNEDIVAAHDTADTAGLILSALTHRAVTLATGVDLASTIGQLLDDGTAWSYDRANESLEALRARGDAAWITGAGGSPPSLLQNTTILAYSSQTSFTLTAGSVDDDAYNGCIIVITDQSTSTQKAVGIITNYTGGSKTVTLGEDPLAGFTFANDDIVDIIAAPKQLPDAVHGVAGGLATVDANNRIAGIQGTKNDLDDLNDITAASVWAVGTRALTDKAGFSLAADQSAVTIGTVTVNEDMVGTDGASTHSETDVWSVGTRALTDKAGFSLAADQSAVTFGTCDVLVANNDKTGYTASTVSDKTGYALVADSSAVTFGTCNVLVTNNDKTGYTASTVSDKTGYSLAADQTSVRIGYVGTATNLAPAALIDIFQEDITTHMSEDTQRVAEYIGVTKYAATNKRAVSAGGVETIYDDAGAAYASATYGTVGGLPYTPGNDEAAQRTRYKGG